MIVVQAEAGAAVASGPPEQASFEAIAATGREAMVEMRRLLGVLHDEAAPERSPQPGLSRLPELVEQVRRAGLPVEVHVEGDPCILPAGVDLTAYRVVQEALTNTLRHGAGAAATVSVRYSPDAVVVDVTDDNAIPRATGQRETGRGLIGMRERVALCGGELEAGPRPEGGFRVRARLPR
jgi:signal transduction histidine kinase